MQFFKKETKPQIHAMTEQEFMDATNNDEAITISMNAPDSKTKCSTQDPHHHTQHSRSQIVSSRGDKIAIATGIAGFILAPLASTRTGAFENFDSLANVGKSLQNTTGVSEIGAHILISVLAAATFVIVGKVMGDYIAGLVYDHEIDRINKKNKENETEASTVMEPEAPACSDEDPQSNNSQSYNESESVDLGRRWSVS